jgi:putative membrane protein
MPLILALFIAGLCAAPCILRGSDAIALGPIDLDFFKQAISVNAAEIRVAYIALHRPLMAPVQELAESMVTTHSAALKKLLSLSQAKASGLAEAIQAGDQSAVDGLNGLADGEVAERFIKMRIECLKRAIDIYTVEISSGTDIDLKALAAAALPQLGFALDAAKFLEAQH